VVNKSGATGIKIKLRGALFTRRIGAFKSLVGKDSTRLRVQESGRGWTVLGDIEWEENAIFHRDPRGKKGMSRITRT